MPWRSSIQERKRDEGVGGKGKRRKEGQLEEAEGRKEVRIKEGVNEGAYYECFDLTQLGDALVVWYLQLDQRSDLVSRAEAVVYPNQHCLWQLPYSRETHAAFIPAIFLSSSLQSIPCDFPFPSSCPTRPLHAASARRSPSTIPFVCKSHMGSLIHPVSDLRHIAFSYYAPL